MLFCLVHGSAQNGACWDLLVPELEAQGHVTVRTHSSVGEQEPASSDYADLILRSMPPDAKDVVLVAHSASGYFLPLVADRRPLRRLVFLAASIPKLGVSFFDQFRADPSILWPDWVGKDPATDDAAAMHFLFHDCPPEIAQWAMTTRIRLPLQKVASETYPLKQWPTVACSYVVCSEDRTIRPEWSRRAAREHLGVEPIEIPGGHCPYLSRPRQLADILVNCTELAD
jgi:hypothetical protein